MRYAVFSRGQHEMRDSGELVAVCFLVADAIECARSRARNGQVARVRMLDGNEIVKSGILARLVSGDAWIPWAMLPGSEMLGREAAEPLDPCKGFPRNYPL